MKVFRDREKHCNNSCGYIFYNSLRSQNQFSTSAWIPGKISNHGEKSDRPDNDRYATSEHSPELLGKSICYAAW